MHGSFIYYKFRVRIFSLHSSRVFPPGYPALRGVWNENIHDPGIIQDSGSTYVVHHPPPSLSHLLSLSETIMTSTCAHNLDTVAMDEPDTPRNEWNAHRETIQDLYQEQNLPLREVIKIMERQYKFHAT